ncbi:MAG: CDP-alcohol phosphatidyltransferase family protein [Bacteroidales bacterium]|nr:CDP-alcohol phosphatidyltransferase family protein [Bacteroidales bacterium]
MEKKVLVWIAKRLPKFVNSDHLTGIGLIGAFIAGGGYALSNLGKEYIWLSSVGFIVNWFGDSLDGNLARVRNKQRPVYGFYVDHNTDAITALIICIGAGVSPFISFSVALLVLVGYFLLCIFTYINTYLNGTCKISYSGFGPTELRLVIILINSLLFILPSENPPVVIQGITLKFFDLFALVVALALMILYFYYFFAEKKKYEKTDPPRS